MPVLYEIFQVPPSMAMHCKQCQLPNECSALDQLVYLRKSESISGHVPVLFSCVVNITFWMVQYTAGQEYFECT